MAIILKNELNTVVTYDTNVPSGSGTVAPNGQTGVMPNGTTEVYWTANPDAHPGGSDGRAKLEVKDNNMYTIIVLSNPL